MRIRIFYSILFVTFSLISCEVEEVIGDPINDPTDKIITDIAIENNNAWVGTFKNGLYKYDGETWTNYKYPEDIVSDTITALTVSDNGIVWVGTNHGLSKFKNQSWSNITELDGLINNDIRSLASDLENNLWIGTRNNRLERYDGQNFTSFHVNPEISGPAEMGHIHTIAPDANGDVWVGSCISGLSKFDGSVWTDKINNLNTFVESSIISPAGELWIGHYSGAYKFSNDNWTRYTDAEGLVGNNVSCLAINLDNNIWIGTASGLSKFDGNEWTNYTVESGLISNNIKALACDQDGELWIGTSEGLMKLSDLD